MIKVIKGNGDEVVAALSRLKNSLASIDENIGERSREMTVKVFGEPLTPRQVVDRILGDVKRYGDKAVIEYTEKFDRLKLTAKTMRVSDEMLKEAQEKTEPELMEAIKSAAANIEKYQNAIIVRDTVRVNSDGINIKQKYVPVKRVGVWVPGGSAPLVSTLMMTAIPARVAGVDEIAVFTPPGADGMPARAVLAACAHMGLGEVYCIQGVAAIGAMTYGTETIPAVDMIAGPGNAFITLAKLSVFGRVGIDMPAGPSEVAIVADATSDAKAVCAGMLAQAEHYPGSAVAIVLDEEMADSLAGMLEGEAAALDRGARALECLEDFGLIIVASSREEALEYVEYIAPEHLEVQCENPGEFAEKVRNAGAVFVGPFTPTALGDYYAGPSHTLPTGSSARFMSGLSANSFMRSFAVIEADEDGLKKAAASVTALANSEGLTAHARSVDARLEKQK